MKQKTARFNYLNSDHSSPEKEKYEYKHIISQLSKEHSYPHPPTLDTPSHAPITTPTTVLQTNNQHVVRKNFQIKTSIAEQSRQARQEPSKKKEIYRIIKESHLMNDRQLDKFQKHSQQKNSMPFRKLQNTPQKITFYPITQLKKQYTPQKYERRHIQKTNQPYINQALSIFPPKQRTCSIINPQANRLIPSLNMTQSQIKRSNKVYRAEKSPERLYEKAECGRNNRETKKRSCFDYVPEELKARLVRVRDYQY